MVYTHVFCEYFFSDLRYVHQLQMSQYKYDLYHWHLKEALNYKGGKKNLHFLKLNIQVLTIYLLLVGLIFFLLVHFSIR